MIRRAHFIAAAVLAVVAFSSCKKGPDYKAYDNTTERTAFYKRFNAETKTRLAQEQQDLEKTLADPQLAEADRKEKSVALDDLKRRLERPDFFEFFTAEQLPQDLKWETNNDEPELGSPEAKKGGTYHSFIQGNAYPPTIRCVGASASNSFRSNHWDDIEMGLAVLHPETGKVIPCLADRWAVAEDGQTVYYHIDDEAKWSDGKEVTSRDFLMTMYVYLSNYLSESHYREYIKGQYWGIATYGDDYLCLRIATPKPMAAYMAAINPFQEDFYKEFGPDFEIRYNWRPRPTTGAYVIREEDIQKGRSISLTRVKDWWAKDRKYYRYRFNPDRLQFMLVLDEEKVFQLFLRGEIDTYWPFADTRKWYEQSEVENVFNGYIEKATYFNEYPSISMGMYMNHHNPLLGNQDIRIGLQHATNWQKVIDFDMRGDAERLHLVAGGFGPYSHPTLRTRPFSVADARAAFARAGFKELGPDGILKDDQGRRLSFTVCFLKRPDREAFMLRIKEEAKKAGVEYKLEGMDGTTFQGKVQRKEHEIAFMGFQPQPPFPDYFQGFHSRQAYEAGTRKPKPMTNNISVFFDPSLDPLLEENRGARNEQVVKDTSYKLEEILHERAVWIPAYAKPFYRVAYWRWIRWPADFNVRLGNDPEMNYVLWIDQDLKKETEDAMKSGRTFPEKNVVYDQHRRKKTAE